MAGRDNEGLADPKLARRIRPGAVFTVTDAAIDFPAERLPSAGARSMHDVRFVVVVQSAVWGPTKAPITVLVVPCSASSRDRAWAWDVNIPDGTPGFDKPRVVAYTSQVQPILKSDVVEHRGDVDPDTLRELRARLLQLLDVSDIPDDSVDGGSP